MAPDKGNDATSSKAPAKERTASRTRRQRLTTSTRALTSPSLPGDSLYAPPPLPTLPFELLVEILQRLPVKSLLLLRCVCKSWNSLISDPKFAKKHLRMSKRHHLILSSTNSLSDFLLWDSPISSVFNAESNVVSQMQLSYPHTLNKQHIYFPSPLIVCSCDGILCFYVDEDFTLLWNPSIRKFKKLPPLESENILWYPSISFGYDHFTDNYKVVAVFCLDQYVRDKTQVCIYTLGTDSWRTIQEYPYHALGDRAGIFVSGTVNWLAFSASSSSEVIVSLDLRKESYQKILQPNYGAVDVMFPLSLGVLRDCLCFFSTKCYTILDFWIMKEYGNEESWTKLFTIPYPIYLEFYHKPPYISEDDQLLLVVSQSRLIVHNSKIGTYKIREVQNWNAGMVPEVYVESLVSPCS